VLRPGWVGGASPQFVSDLSCALQVALLRDLERVRICALYAGVHGAAKRVAVVWFLSWTADLAFAWLLANPAVTSVIAGATKPEQVAANAATVGWKLSPQDLVEIDTILSADS